MQHVRLLDNPLDPATWEEVEVEDVRALMVERYPDGLPAGVRFYSGGIGDDHEITLATPGDFDSLATYDELTMIMFPEGPVALIVAIVAAVVLTIALMFLLPAIPDLSNVQTGSGNNSLSERQNRPRPNARIPDIYGTVRSIPDMLSVPYRVFENHKELEICYMCVGRGAYVIDDVRDGDTLVADIAGASVAIYAPFDSPNGGDTPQLQIGTAISDPLFNVQRLNEVNGQVLKAPNDTAVRADQEIKFTDGGIIEASGGGIDFRDYFEPDDDIDLGNATGGQQTTPVGIFADATGSWISSGVYGKFIFTTLDPTDYFTAGQRVRVSQAVWTTTTGGGGGGVPGGGGGGGGPDNPTWPEVIFPDVPTE